MSAIERLRELLPEAASDLQLNLGAVLETTTLGGDQKWLVALACAFASGNAKLREAVLSDARSSAPDAVLEDARAAAALMGMNIGAARGHGRAGAGRSSHRRGHARRRLRPRGLSAAQRDERCASTRCLTTSGSASVVTSPSSS